MFDSNRVVFEDNVFALDLRTFMDFIPISDIVIASLPRSFGLQK